MHEKIISGVVVRTISKEIRFHYDHEDSAMQQLKDAQKAIKKQEPFFWVQGEIFNTKNVVGVRPIEKERI